MRKLASIQKVVEVQNHPNGDVLDISKVLGWNVVTKRNEFKVGDKVVYIEIDSILPDKPEFEFLRNKGFRIKTIRLRGIISQGICFPLSILPDGEYNEGDDVTDIIKVEKYEPPISPQLSGQVKGNFPGWIQKTDEIRVQADPTILIRHKYKIFNAYEKIDGSSVTFYYNDGEFGVCSRNMDLKETEGNSFWNIARKYDIENILKSNVDSSNKIFLQGELFGEGIQGNKLKMKGHDVRFYNLFRNNQYEQICINKFESQFGGLKWVPFLNQLELNHTVDELVELSIIKSTLNKDVWAEGIVYRPSLQEHYNEYDVSLGRLSFKVINPEFLLKNGE